VRYEIYKSFTTQKFISQSWSFVNKNGSFYCVEQNDWKTFWTNAKIGINRPQIFHIAQNFKRQMILELKLFESLCNRGQCNTKSLNC